MYVTHEQIANHFGTTREVVSREIEGFRNQGLISTGRGRITVLDRKGLDGAGRALINVHPCGRGTAHKYKRD
jgi:predicted transcriptional regulator